MTNTTTKKTTSPTYLGGLNANATITATGKVLRAEHNNARVKAVNGKTVAYAINNRLGNSTDLKYLAKTGAITIS
tara:strand:+ start:820 stop:1044 length:225 start_codon:yes stop_codon:yes gene_type:complete